MFKMVKINGSVKFPIWEGEGRTRQCVGVPVSDVGQGQKRLGRCEPGCGATIVDGAGS